MAFVWTEPSVLIRYFLDIEAPAIQQLSCLLVSFGQSLLSILSDFGCIGSDACRKISRDRGFRADQGRLDGSLDGRGQEC